MCDACPRSQEPVDGLRAEVARLTADLSHAEWKFGRQVTAANDYYWRMVKSHEAERDAAIRPPAALREGVESVLAKWCNEDGDIEFESGFDGMRLAADLRALLAAHPAETNGDDRG